MLCYTPYYFSSILSINNKTEMCFRKLVTCCRQVPDANKHNHHLFLHDIDSTSLTFSIVQNVPTAESNIRDR